MLLPNTVQKKRVTLYKPPFETAAARVPGGEVALRREFEAANWLDMRLYAAATRRFERHMQKQESSAAAVMKFGGSNAGGRMTTVGDRYDYLLKYAKRSSIATPFAPDDGQELAGVEEAVAAADKAAHAALNRQPSLGAGYVHQLECMCDVSLTPLVCGASRREAAISFARAWCTRAREFLPSGVGFSVSSAPPTAVGVALSSDGQPFEAGDDPLAAVERIMGQLCANVGRGTVHPTASTGPTKIN